MLRSQNAVKIARAHTGRSALVAFHGGYHGRTLMTLGLTGKVVPYIIEPVQGEGGFYVAPFDFLRELRMVCDAHGILLIADEVQSGAGRTGKMFAVEHSGVVPDLITLAKSIAGGFPVSAVVGRANVMDAVAPGGLGGTYAGSPLGCAAALAVLDVLEEEGILERSLALGERMMKRLTELSGRRNAIGDVRGLGAMVAMELFRSEDGKRVPDPKLTQDLVGLAAERGLILLSCGMHRNAIRILVPITASDQIVDEGLDIIEGCLETLVVR